MLDIHGPGAALVTLRCLDGSVDALAMGHLAARVVANGATSLLVAGTTGQSSECTFRERLTLARAVAAAGVPVVVGLPALVTARSVRDLKTAGAHAALAGTSQDLAATLSACQAAGLPLLAYHHPVHGLRLDSRLVSAAGRDGLAGVKDSSGDLRTLQDFIATGVPVLAGGTAVLAHARAAGAAGLLSGLGSAFPDLVARAWYGDEAAQSTLQEFDQRHPNRIAALKAAAASPPARAPR